MKKQNDIALEDPNNPAGGEEPAGKTNPQGGENPPADSNSGDLKYTDAQLDEIVQQRIARERATMEKKIREQIAEEAKQKETQAKKLESMTELERAQHEAAEYRKQVQQLQQEQDLQEQMRIARKELADANIALTDELLGIFVSSDADKTAQAIKDIKDLFPKAINDGVQAALKRNPPAAEPPDPMSESFGATYATNYSNEKKPKED